MLWLGVLLCLAASWGPQSLMVSRVMRLEESGRAIGEIRMIQRDSEARLAQYLLTGNPRDWEKVSGLAKKIRENLSSMSGIAELVHVESALQMLLKAETQWDLFAANMAKNRMAVDAGTFRVGELQVAYLMEDPERHWEIREFPVNEIQNRIQMEIEEVHSDLELPSKIPVILAFVLSMIGLIRQWNQ